MIAGGFNIRQHVINIHVASKTLNYSMNTASQSPKKTYVWKMHFIYFYLQLFFVHFKYTYKAAFGAIQGAYKWNVFLF